MVSVFIHMVLRNKEKRLNKGQTSTFHWHNIARYILRIEIIAFASWGFFCENMKCSKLEIGQFHLGSSGSPCLSVSSDLCTSEFIYTRQVVMDRICRYTTGVWCAHGFVHLDSFAPVHCELCSKDLLLLLKVIKISIQYDNVLILLGFSCQSSLTVNTHITEWYTAQFKRPT